MGRYIIKKVDTGIKFDLEADNYQVIATSEVYESKRACMDGINSVVAYASVIAIEDQTKEGYEKVSNPKFEIYIDKNQQFRFHMNARNGKILIFSEGYTTKKACLQGIDSVRLNASSEIHNTI